MKQRDYIMLCRSLEDKQMWVHHIQLAIDESKNGKPNSSSAEARGHVQSGGDKKTEKSPPPPYDNGMNIAMVGKMDTMSQHLRTGVDISAHDPLNGQTMLHKLSHAGQVTLLHLLLESHPNNPATLVNQKDFSGGMLAFYLFGCFLAFWLFFFLWGLAVCRVWLFRGFGFVVCGFWVFGFLGWLFGFWF
eukprot:Phypoly_transcript_10879.p1 GENE.Phypoly_transcript_10879~~Phypoly_transcript_10879.p1  ORF type:complete len:189 (+),score=25.21 Phypoly_transcript_10879:516-1082(+)